VPGWCLGTLSGRGPLLGIFGRIGSCGAFSPIVHTIPLSVKFVKPPLRIAQRHQDARCWYHLRRVNSWGQ